MFIYHQFNIISYYINLWLCYWFIHVQIDVEWKWLKAVSTFCTPVPQPKKLNLVPEGLILKVALHWSPLFEHHIVVGITEGKVHPATITIRHWISGFGLANKPTRTKSKKFCEGFNICFCSSPDPDRTIVLHQGQAEIAAVEHQPQQWAEGVQEWWKANGQGVN